MSKLLKIIISFFIVTLICITIYFLFYLNILNIEKFDFLNNFQESKIKRNLSDLSTAIENFLDNQDKINKFLSSIDFKKFEEKKKIININDTLSDAKNLIISEDYLEKIKFYDNFGKVIFSTDDEEKIIHGNYVSFISKDNIEKRDDFYSFSKDKNSYLLSKNNIILKKNIISSNKSIGCLLFYYNISFIIDILRKSNITEIKQPYLAGKNIIIIDKPDLVNEEYLFDFSIDNNKLRTIVYKDKFGNEIKKIYRVFSFPLKKNSLIVCKLVDNSTFILDKRIKFILFFVSVYTLYLLVLAILLLLEKSRLDRLRGRASLFTSELIEEIINARNRGELEKIQRQFLSKKDDIFKNLFNENKRIDEKTIKGINDELDIVFKKINELVEQKIKDYSGIGNLDKVEQLLEKFVNTIAEKGIQINTPVKISQARVKENEAEEVKKLDEVSEAEEIEELGEVSEAEEIEELDEVQEIKKNEESDKVREAEESKELTEVQESKEITQQSKPINEFSIIQETEKIPEIELSEEITLVELEEEEVPKIPMEFYEDNKKNDSLAQTILEITREKSELELLLEKIYEESGADKLSLLISVKKKNSFIQISQVGAKNLGVEKIVFDEENILIKHIYATNRMTFVSDIKRFKKICDNPIFLKTYSDMKSLFIYPFRIFGKIRSVILLFFREEKSEILEDIVDIFERDKNVLRKNLVKII